MSYYFNMYFKNIETKLETYEFCRNITKMFTQKEMKEKWLEKFKYTYPKARFGHDMDLLKDNPMATKVGERMLEQMIGYWLRKIFSFKFFYWEEYGLLGLMLDRLPQEIAGEFETSIDFQSSVDQDYSYETWCENIPIFKEVVDFFKEMSLDSLANLIEKSDNIFIPENEDDEENFFERIVREDEERYRKLLIYQTIVDKLDLMSALNDRESKDFITFTFCAVDTEEKEMDCRLLLMEKEKEWL